MAQKSITSFFSVQKRKLETSPEENSAEDNTAKNCITNGGAFNDKASPLVKEKKKVRRIETSSDEEDVENVPLKSSNEVGAGSSSSNTSSPEQSKTAKKPARKIVKKGAAALKALEEKRAANAAKKLKLDSGEVKVVNDVIKDTAEVSDTSKEEAISKSCEDVAKLSDDSKSNDSETEAGNSSGADMKVEDSIDTAKEGVEDSSGKSTEESAAKKTEENTENSVAMTSDFSDSEDNSDKDVSKNKPVKKKGAKSAISKKSKKSSPVSASKEASSSSSAKKESPATAKKSATSSKTIHSFFAPRPKKEVKTETSPIKEKPQTETSPKDSKPVVKIEDSKPRKETVDSNPSDAESDSKTSGSLKIAKAVSKGKGSDYDPSKANYDPIEDACWEKGQVVPYLALAKTLEAVESISARLKIVEALSNYFRSVIVLSPDNLLHSVYLCLNQLAPAFEGLELGVAEKSLMKAVAQSSGRSAEQVLAELESTGDLGVVAQNSCGKQAKLFRPSPLTVPGVFAQLKAIASMSGRASMSRKLDKVASMYVACQPIEARYLLRSCSGKLRIGLAEQSVLQALALACVTTPPAQSEYPPPILNAAKKKGVSAESFKAELDNHALILKTTYCECPIYDRIIPIILKHGLKELPNHCQISPGVPLRPMLAHPTKGVQEVLSRFDGRRFTCEWKYDGERAQIHLTNRGRNVRIFSRNQEENTSKYPDLVSRLSEQLESHVEDCILDCEAVAWDREAKKILPFQVLSTRKKKDANETDIKVQVCLFVFDLLYLNGEPLVRVPLKERRRKLRNAIKEVEGEMQLAECLDTNNLEEVQNYLILSIRGNCEGLMVKTLEEEATYEIAKRSRNWLKLKKDYLDGVGDTLDLVVLGGYLGRGKRVGVYGGFLLGCYDPESEEYQTICKIGTGFSDESLQTHSEFFKEHILPAGPRTYYRHDPSLSPDHWFDAVQVWEVKCADLSLSPIHKAALGIVDPEKGISLRFPRFLRIRDDKKVEESTSASQVADLYQNQEQVKNQDAKIMDEEDFY